MVGVTVGSDGVSRRLVHAASGFVALLLLTVVLVPPATAASDDGAASSTESTGFDDVGADHPFFHEIEWLAEEGIAEGFPDGTFGDTLPVTRQAMAAFLYRFSVGAEDPPACLEPPFSDVPVDHEFCAEIAWLVAQGITQGYGDDTFGPGLAITRQAMAAFLYREAGNPDGEAPECDTSPFVDVPTDHPFCGEIAWLAGQGVSIGFHDGTFGTDSVITRQAMAAFMWRLALLEDPGDPVPSAGCGTATMAPVEELRVDVEIDGTERWYLLTVPPGHDGETPIPLVVDFHGLAEGATIHTQMSAYSELAWTEGFAVAFPHGTGTPVRWNVGAGDDNPDLAFVDAILDTLGEQLCLDESRFYATGLSFGGFMTSRIACSRSDRFAAVAPVAGVVMPEPCDTERAVPLITFHGTDDHLLHYDGGVGIEEEPPAVVDSLGPTQDEDPPRAPEGMDLTRPIPEQVALWAAHDGCLPDPVDTQITDEVIHRVYRCPTGSAVELYIVIGGGHAWPGSEFSKLISFAVGYTTFDISATELSWAFFQRFHLPTP